MIDVLLGLLFAGAGYVAVVAVVKTWQTRGREIEGVPAPEAEP